MSLCDVPKGQPGRPSKSLTLVQAIALLAAAEGLEDDYTIVSLVTGARTEEMRALAWSHVDLVGRPHDQPPVPPSTEVWRSVREGGDTKTKKSRRTLALAELGVTSLRRRRERQDVQRERAGSRWREAGLVFTTSVGTAQDAANVRRAFRRTVKAAGLDPGEWSPRELRHSFVSLLSDHGVSLEDIAPLVGHAGTSVTEKVYRHQLRPVLLTGAVVMDRILRAGQQVRRQAVSQAGHGKGHVHRWDMASDLGGRYWDRTSDLFGVNAPLYPIFGRLSQDLAVRDAVGGRQHPAVCTPVVTQLGTHPGPPRRPCPHRCSRARCACDRVRLLRRRVDRMAAVAEQAMSGAKDFSPTERGRRDVQAPVSAESGRGPRVCRAVEQGGRP